MIAPYAASTPSGHTSVDGPTEVTDLEVTDGAISGVITKRGRIKTGTVVNATAGYASTIAAMAGQQIPLETHPLQAMVTEPLKPWLNPIVVSASMHMYVSQSTRGELVAGASLDPYELTSMRSTLGFAESLATDMADQSCHLPLRWAALSIIGSS